ncbi:MAG: hypothetical protein ACO20H_00425 [Bacteriovoracaceae bacterium]
MGGDGADEERVFLHDVSNHLVVAQGMANYTLTKIQAEKPEDAKEVVRLQKAVKAIDEMVTLVKARREKIKSAG